MDCTSLMRTDISSFTPYPPSPTINQLAKQLRRNASSIIKANVGENPAVLSAYQEALSKVDLFRYPDPFSLELREKLSAYCNHPLQGIFCANGSDDAIDVLTRLFVEPGDEVIICPPTFPMYRTYAQLSYAKIIDVNRKSDFSLDISGIVSAVSSRTKLIYIDSPGNPCGVAIHEDAILELLKQDTIVVLDEAYYEYYGKTMQSYVATHPNLVVVRTFSKWAGLAGLRVGYILADSEIIKALEQLKMPYNVNVVGQLLACAALDHRDSVFAKLAYIKQVRNQAIRELSAIQEIEVLPSETAYIVIRCLNRSAVDARRYLHKNAIFVKLENQPFIENSIRINLATTHELATFLYYFTEWVNGTKN